MKIIQFPKKNEVKSIEVFKVVIIDKCIDSEGVEWYVSGITHDGDGITLGWFATKTEAVKEAMSVYTDSIVFTTNDTPISRLPKDDRWTINYPEDEK